MASDSCFCHARSEITEFREGRGIRFRLSAGFEYRVNGSVYTGQYSENFNARAEAEHIASSLRSGPLFVRYLETDPSLNHLDPYRDVVSTQHDEPADSGRSLR